MLKLSRIFIILFGLLFISGATQSKADDEPLPLAPVAVSSDGHYLLKADGAPFHWIGDTAWDLHHRLTQEEITEYLENRKAKGYTIILFRIPLNEKSGADEGNRYGHFPFNNKQIDEPNEDFFALVDYTLDEMERLELVAGFLPLWGWVVGGKFGYSVTDEEVDTYGTWLSERYQDRKNIIWISGGDTGNSGKWVTLGEALKDGDPQKLVTFHPGRGWTSSYHMFGDADWLDFHMTQTGHTADLPTNYETVNEVYNQSSKPILNGEPIYEEIRLGSTGTIASPHQVRKAAYWSVLAGGFGHVYGHVNIFQFARSMDGQTDSYGANDYWKNSLNDPGANQIGYLSSLLRSLDWHTYAPAQDLITSNNPSNSSHIRASASAGNESAVIYFPENQQATIDTSQLNGIDLALWFNPSDGTWQDAGSIPGSGSWTVTPPVTPDALLYLGNSPCFSLDPGWNTVSINYAPIDPDLDVLLLSIVSKMILMKSGDGSIFWPDLGIDNIGQWQSLEGYQVLMEEAGSFCVDGLPLDPRSTPIPLPAGWSLISYLPQEPMPVEDALQSIMSDLYLIKDGEGNIYWPEFSIDQIGDMEAGKGYLIYLESAATLVYPAD